MIIIFIPLFATLLAVWCQTLVTLQAGQRYELQLHASATGIGYWSAGVDSNHHMAAYKTASLNHWRTRGFWCGVRGSNPRPPGCKPEALPTELIPHNCGFRIRPTTPLVYFPDVTLYLPQWERSVATNSFTYSTNNM